MQETEVQQQRSSQKITKSLANLDMETDSNVLRQLKDTLNYKIRSLKCLDEDIIELMSSSEAENADKELMRGIEEADNLRAEMQKIVLDANDLLSQTTVSPVNHKKLFERSCRS